MSIYTDKLRQEAAGNAQKYGTVRDLVQSTLPPNSKELKVEPPTQESFLLATRLGAFIGKQMNERNLTGNNRELLPVEAIQDYASHRVWGIFQLAFYEELFGHEIEDYGEFVDEHAVFDTEYYGREA